MRTYAGNCHKLGATFTPKGVNFALWAHLASQVELLLFAHDTDTQPQVLTLDPKRNRTAYYWHIFVPDITAGQLYAYRIDGPWRPYEGTLFDADKVLLDPYGLEVALGSNYRRLAACGKGSNLAECAKSVVVDPRAYDWEDDSAPNHDLTRSVIYELHVKGFTAHASADISADKRGTYAGLIEKIPYLKSLGITAVELMPVYQFDPQDAPDGLHNYWGYSPISFFAPHAEYSSDRRPMGAVDEFRDMVKALHRNDIEVYLDVVYNHTAEGGEGGPTLCFRGIDNNAYYILDPVTQQPTNYSGCGNTFNGSNSVVRRLITDSLHYWRQCMHVDGFRFDLAAILSRDEEGRPLAYPPTLYSIDTDPLLADCKLIAEAWDPGGLYQVGTLAGSRWREWNGPFRDDVRRFVKGDENTIPKLANRLLGSPDIYSNPGADPEKSVNFVTCHDGFTLYDLVAYNNKHNLANGEGNRDGHNDNQSWNCGAEGKTADAAINRLRLRQAKNLITITLLSIGSPMLLMGDECLRTQSGNNNAYCQDNPLSWLDWTPTRDGQTMRRYVTELIKYRKYLFGEQEDSGIPMPLPAVLGKAEVRWHGIQPEKPDWAPHSHAIAMTARARSRPIALYMVFNAYWESLEFVVPSPPDGIEGYWRRILDTALPEPDDIIPLGEPLAKVFRTYRMEARSVCMMISGDLTKKSYRRQ